MRSSRNAAMAVIALCALGLGAGCGDDDEDSGGGAAASTQAEATTTAPAGSPLKIGVIDDTTGPIGAANQAFGRGFKVWVKDINAKGGIQGHPVQADLRDTKSDVTTLLSVTKQLLADDSLIAFVPGSSQGVPISKLLAASSIPAVGGLAADPLWFTNPNVFPSGTTPDAQAAAIAQLGVEKAGGAGTKVADFYCTEVPSCKGTIPIFKAGVEKAGGTLTYTAGISGSAPDYTAQCLTAKGKGAKVLWIAAAASTYERVAKDCAKNDFKPVYVNPAYSSSEGKVPELDGMQVVSPQATHTSQAAAEFRAAAAKYDPGMIEELASPTFAVEAWAAGKLIEAAIKASGVTTGDVTAADVRKGLYALKGETLGGLAPPLSFTKGKPASQPCFFAAEVKGGTLVQDGEAAVCPS